MNPHDTFLLVHPRIIPRSAPDAAGTSREAPPPREHDVLAAFLFFGGLAAVVIAFWLYPLITVGIGVLAGLLLKTTLYLAAFFKIHGGWHAIRRHHFGQPSRLSHTGGRR